MHALVVKVNIDDLEKGRHFLTEQIVPRVSQAPGFVAGYWTASADNSNGLSVIVFESEDAAREVSQMIESQGMHDRRQSRRQATRSTGPEVTATRWRRPSPPRGSCTPPGGRACRRGTWRHRRSAS